jgi:aspartyl-tRNA(Asn)/glutamyl-tRNA(Gln) amidotransferase subunit B
MAYETVIGLEVHVQLKTKSKVFCGCANQFGSKENTNICPVCLGLPGSLPVLNVEVLKSGAKAGLALNAQIRSFIKFDRKNYFYPDLPKNFQISQFDMPLAENGFLEIVVDGVLKKIRIKRVHMEEDAGKLIHPDSGHESLVDYNRTGSPLLEIVTEPDISSPEEAYQYLSDLKLLLEYLDISDCDMEKGILRCDANVSLRPVGATALGTKAELKNMNSFKAVRAALGYEIERQTEALEKGERIIQETRLWDDKAQKSFSMRSKEEAHDYRYFPEPDLPPFVFSDAQIDQIQKTLPELPQERSQRFQHAFGFSDKDAAIMISTKELADFFEVCLKFLNEPKKIANWLMGPVFSHMNAKNFSIKELGLAPENLTELVKVVDEGLVSNLVAKDVLGFMLETGGDPRSLIKEKNLAQVSGEDVLSGIIEEVVAKNKKSVDDYLTGKENALMFLVGQVMKLSGGKANPKVARELMALRLKKC